MPGIDKHRWGVLSPLLDELLEADEGVRKLRLAHIRDTDSDLADDLSSLLHRQAAIEREGFLEGLATLLPEPTLAGRIVGSYTLERLLGRGGMGAVWLAHRSDGRYAARAAVKLLNLSLLGRAGADRFKREGSALARLAHPNIARLNDAGVTSEGQPYLVIEYVEGEPIDRWCQARNLDVHARVRLFLQVLDAVAHAHSKLILHRDLKPPNILVTPQGQVKLLDFGIAKLLDDEHAPATSTAVTKFPGHAFTPEYAAPEQVQGAEVTTATDVYALGVLLYSLLTSRHPTADPSQTPVDQLRAVVDMDPVRPSQTVRALRGDLDNIIAKALKKVPSERYRTVASLGDDLQRYLNQQPVSARPDSMSYRAGRFVARNRAVVGATAVALLAIVVATGVSVWQAQDAKMQRDHARALSARNNVVVEFVSSMLTEVVPAEQPIRIGDLLERSEKVLLGAETRPDMQAAIMNIVATYFLNAGDVAKAQPLLTRSLELTQSSPDVALRAELLCGNALAASMQGRAQEAQAQVREALALASEDAPTPARCTEIATKVAGRQ